MAMKRALRPTSEVKVLTTNKYTGSNSTVDATPLDVAYVEKAEKLGLIPIIYFGDVVHTRLGGFGVSLDKIRKNPTQISRVIKARLIRCHPLAGRSSRHKYSRGEEFVFLSPLIQLVSV